MTVGDRLRSWFGMSPRATFGEPLQARFATYPVDQIGFLKILGIDGRGNGRAAAGRRIDRRSALSVPAVLRGRNLICSISTLPLEQVDKQNRVQDSELFEQFDSNIANVVHLAMTAEDLLFESVAWWKVISFDSDGMPAKVARYSPSTVSLQPPPGWQKAFLPSDLPTEGQVWMEGKPVPFSRVIRFDSPNPPLLEAGERSIRRALDLDDSADLYANNRRMRGFFTPSDPTVDPPKEKVIEALDSFALARKERLDGYVGAALDYHPIQDPTPAEIQILAQQQRADLAIANALGIDPEDLGISTTSRTYQNGIDRRQDRINDVLAPYMKAITDRLSMPDVTLPGRRACFRLAGYLKADPKTRAEVEQIYEAMGVTDAEEIREVEEMAPRAIEPPPAPQPMVPANPVSAIPAPPVQAGAYQ